MNTSSIKIVFMVGGPITSRWNDYYCIDALRNSFDIEFWNFYNIIDNGYNVSSTLKREYEVNLIDIDDLKRNLIRLPKNSLFVIELGFVESYYGILKIISEYNSSCIIIDFWTYYVWSVANSGDDNRFNREDSPIIYKKIKKSFKNNIVLRFIYDLILHNGYKNLYHLTHVYGEKIKERKAIDIERECNQLFRKYIITYKPFQKYTINHPDYEKYLKIKNFTERNDKYIVFIADFYPYHPEIVLDDGIKKEYVAKLYYNSINDFFNKLECVYGCKVVIAEHPSAKWNENPFNGREIVYYKTAELVRDSIGVCMHASCAFSYVALFNKPVVVITNDALQFNVSMRNTISQIAKSIGQEPFDVDINSDVSHIMRLIPDDVRKKYIQTFADADSNLPNEELFKRHYVSIYNEMYGVK